MAVETKIGNQAPVSALDGFSCFRLGGVKDRIFSVTWGIKDYRDISFLENMVGHIMDLSQEATKIKPDNLATIGKKLSESLLSSRYSYSQEEIAFILQFLKIGSKIYGSGETFGGVNSAVATCLMFEDSQGNKILLSKLTPRPEFLLSQN